MLEDMTFGRLVILLAALAMMGPVARAEEGASTLSKQEAAAALKALPLEARRNVVGKMRVTALHRSGAAKEARGMVRGTERVHLFDEAGVVLETRGIVGPLQYSEFPSPSGDMALVRVRMYRDGQRLAGEAARSALREFFVNSSLAELAVMSAEQRSKQLGDSTPQAHAEEMAEFLFMMLGGQLD